MIEEGQISFVNYYSWCLTNEYEPVKGSETSGGSLLPKLLPQNLAWLLPYTGLFLLVHTGKSNIAIDLAKCTIYYTKQNSV